ncbi:hypothetical protein QO001_002183 [Methylobacterium brachiatum]|uniref:Uncharacterized protein n=1 Tax=Methylobacterium brachiatum TaxID=269660 RepID=A0AAJ1TTV4_9HYPH|nr:hypothetical protein [Methylobacterium brachiatum]MCB4802631.1 hypothetical protein [Methylobacterium brachiatum]MDQ0543257.1 hypothetical protein [Methylobacterium brachiatum]
MMLDIQTALRGALRDLPILAAHGTGMSPDASSIYFPEGHADALDPEVALVIGNRGMGKSFWASALADPRSRRVIGSAYMGRARALRSKNLNVHFGFADAEGANGSVSRIQLESVPPNIPADVIWRAIVVRILNPNEAGLPKKFSQYVEWASENLEELQSMLRSADRQLFEEGRQTLVLFDQLEQLADDWPRIQTLTQGLLKTALAMRSYRSVKIKIFMRPDQSENRDLFRFPDAAKISGSGVRLRWRPLDLYGLLYFHIWRDEGGCDALQSLMQQLSLRINENLEAERIPTMLAYDEVAQRKLFEQFAGQFMGANAKRGRPYTWIPVHLADGRLEISPRTFLRVIKTAADLGNNRRTAIDYLGIQQGVRQASENRLTELSEDYPWVQEALAPLSGLLVPADPDEIVGRWIGSDVIPRILDRYSGMSAPLDLALSTGDQEPEIACYSLLNLLSEIGVFEERINGKVNVPDIFRVNAGIRRRGGITPEQRRLLGRVTN